MRMFLFLLLMGLVTVFSPFAHSDYVQVDVSRGHDYFLPTTSVERVSRAMVRVGSDFGFAGAGLQYQSAFEVDDLDLHLFGMFHFDLFKINQDRNFLSLEVFQNLSGRVTASSEYYSYSPVVSIVSDIGAANWLPTFFCSAGTTFNSDGQGFPQGLDFVAMGFKKKISLLEGRASLCLDSSIDIGLSLDYFLSPQVYFRSTPNGKSAALSVSAIF